MDKFVRFHDIRSALDFTRSFEMKHIEGLGQYIRTGSFLLELWSGLEKVTNDSYLLCAYSKLTPNRRKQNISFFVVASISVSLKIIICIKLYPTCFTMLTYMGKLVSQVNF